MPALKAAEEEEREPVDDAGAPKAARSERAGEPSRDDAGAEGGGGGARQSWREPSRRGSSTATPRRARPEYSRHEGVWRTARPGRRAAGERRLKTNTLLSIGEHSVRVEAFRVPQAR